MLNVLAAVLGRLGHSENCMEYFDCLDLYLQATFNVYRNDIHRIGPLILLYYTAKIEHTNTKPLC